jgi:hypothetical protein
MARARSPVEVAAGKLISAIQHEWSAELGEPCAQESEAVMDSCHALLQAAKIGNLPLVLGTSTVTEYLGPRWVESHPNVQPYVQALEVVAKGGLNA